VFLLTELAVTDNVIANYHKSLNRSFSAIRSDPTYIRGPTCISTSTVQWSVYFANDRVYEHFDTLDSSVLKLRQTLIMSSFPFTSEAYLKHLGVVLIFKDQPRLTGRPGLYLSSGFYWYNFNLRIYGSICSTDISCRR